MTDPFDDGELSTAQLLLHVVQLLEGKFVELKRRVWWLISRDWYAH